MKLQARLFLVSATLLALARGNPVTTGDAIPVQENLEEQKLYGKWYSIAIGTTCRWMLQHQHRFNMGTLVVAPGKTSEEISLTSTRIRQGVCSKVTADYQKTDIPGKIQYYHAGRQANIENYMARTNYDEYAILVMVKNSTQGLSTTAKLYGRSPELSENLLTQFRHFALGLGIPEDAIFNLINKGECVPSEQQHEPQRVRRTTFSDDGGSADGPLQNAPGNQEDDCHLPRELGPCHKMQMRYFYNGTSQMCEAFFFGGCLGNANNFHSERACLQTCRTEAACRLPIVPGGACDDTFWAFDANQGKCVTFKGCGSNANKFYLEKECKEYCGVLPDGDDEFLRLPPQ
ncbi:protein AMBP isoform X2 [Elgaria multicarinata webbii]|uniref:protein AMBP isoform X2 n=1 Tax=Elgaria multicarinata webbii TaxID=159646 RepID=UPI002FCCC14E